MLSADNLNFDPDQARQNVGPDLDPNCLTLFLKEIFKKVDFEKNQQTTKKPAKLPSVNGLVTDGNTKLCSRGFVLALFQSTYKIDSEHI